MFEMFLDGTDKLTIWQFKNLSHGFAISSRRVSSTVSLHKQGDRDFVSKIYWVYLFLDEWYFFVENYKTRSLSVLYTAEHVRQRTVRKEPCNSITFFVFACWCRPSTFCVITTICSFCCNVVSAWWPYSVLRPITFLCETDRKNRIHQAVVLDTVAHCLQWAV